MRPEIQAVEAEAPSTPPASVVPEAAGPLVRPAVAVGATVVLGAVVYAALGYLISSPHRFSDELMYWDAAGSLADGHGVRVRGEPYLFGPLYPVLLAPILWGLPHRDVAYEVAKVLNAVLFSLVAVPTYLLARRVLRPWSSVGVAALSVAVPWSMYVSVVTTESLAYLTGACALYAIALVLERPTARRQLIALATLGVAVAARPELGALVIVYVLSLATVLLTGPSRGNRLRGALAPAWPSLLVLGLGVVGVVLPRLLRGESIVHWASGYSALWRTYRPGPVLTWLVYHLANLELALGVVPFVVTPIVVTILVARAREGSVRHRAFLALFGWSCATFFGVAATFNSTPWGDFALHDRVIFYVVPLWLVVLFVWLEEGMPRPWIATSVGAVVALALPVSLAIDFSDYARDEARQQFNGVGTTLWAEVRAALASSSVPGWAVLLLFALALTTATILVSRRLSGVYVALVLAVFVVTGELSWLNAGRVADAWGASVPSADRRWLDERVPQAEAVTFLIAPASCKAYQQTNDALYLSEFFNSAVGRVVYVGQPRDGLPTEVLHIAGDGRLLTPAGSAVTARYAVAETGLGLRGERRGVGARGRLALWRIDGEVRLRATLTRRQLAAISCLRKARP